MSTLTCRSTDRRIDTLGRARPDRRVHVLAWHAPAWQGSLVTASAKGCTFGRRPDRRTRTVPASDAGWGRPQTV